jgi:16S rRNA (adenine1518-N6/adenine1519-N6)-dimethyltransferase
LYATEATGQRQAGLEVCYTAESMARQRLGQHFLADATWRQRIARAIGVSGADPSALEASPYCWIEVGAGHGEMTEYLVLSGAPVHAVELDPPLVARLNRLAARFPNLQVVSGNILEIDLAGIAEGRRIRFYGNLPYYITSPILHRFFEIAPLVEQVHIVIQREVASRLVARPGTRDYGYLSVLTQYFAKPAVALQLPPGAFRPPPEVDSALVSLHLPGENAKLPAAEEGRFLAFVKTCFAQKRKTLANNLRALARPEHTRAVLSSLGVGGSARAEELTVKQLTGAFQALGGPGRRERAED